MQSIILVVVLSIIVIAVIVHICPHIREQVMAEVQDVLQDEIKALHQEVTRLNKVVSEVQAQPVKVKLDVRGI